MRELFGGIPSVVIDTMIYGGIVLAMLTGLFKCIFPMLHLTRLFRKAIRALGKPVSGDNSRPRWQDSLFLGRPMQKQWKSFLKNAEQLDARNLSCNTEDFINDTSVLIDYTHVRVAEMIPGMLTSFGILGTFIGLMRGIGGLDISNADSTMKGISQMIGGMAFAYGTSIAGLTCSLTFNVLNRLAQGSVTQAMDDFHTQFHEIVMPKPLEDDVHQRCYLEDQALFLKQSSQNLQDSLSNGIANAINTAFHPIGLQMNDFILAQTQGQLEGLNRIVGKFMQQMDHSLSGQFRELAVTLSGINQAQSVSFESIERALAASESVMQSVGRMNKLSTNVLDRFDRYVNELSASQAGNAHLAEESSKLMNNLYASLKQQSESYKAISQSQKDLHEQMQAYAQWSGHVLETVEKQSDGATLRAKEVADQMAASGQLLKDNYASFVENISSGLARSMGLFEENMRDLIQIFSKQLMEAKQSAQSSDIQAMSRLQQAMGELTHALNNAVVKMNSFAKEAGNGG